MATEIVRLCDAHLFTDERVQGTAYAVTLGAKSGTVDLCQDHMKMLLGPVLDLMATEKGHSGRKPDPGSALCFLCPLTMRPDRMSSHLKQVHGASLKDVYGLTCPLCMEEKATVQGVGTHARLMHGLPSVVDTWVALEDAGDPDGVVAARRAGAIRGDRP